MILGEELDFKFINQEASVDSGMETTGMRCVCVVCGILWFEVCV